MKSVKSIFVAILCVIMVLSMVACGGAKPEGKYVLSEVTGEGSESFNKEQMEQIGVEMYIQFNADGTGEINLAIASTEMTWDSKYITIKEEKTKYQLDGNKVILEADGSKMVFVKED